MFTSFSTALSALNATSTAIDVVGNNLANLNTPGFKASVVSFHDLVTQSLGAGLGETQVGFGVGRPITLREFTQGAQQTTNGPLDVMIQGDGFFVVSSPNSGTEYTRGGNLEVDKDGNLTTATGEQLQGWTSAGGVPNTNLPISNIVVPVGGVKAPVKTGSFSFDINLNAAASAGPPPDTFSDSIKIYDSLGASHTVTVNFTKNAAPGQWDYAIAMPPGDFSAAQADVTGSIHFSPNGVMDLPLSTDTPPQIVIPDGAYADGAAGMTINWNLFSGTTPRITQYGQPSSPSAAAQDGSPAAQLIQVAIGNGGTILARYSDGGQTVVGQLAMATIRNPESLIAVGNNNYQASGKTALPAIGTPDAGGRGTVVGGSVESSTVDIAKEFTNLIVFQRAYQANAKVITTVDQLSQETINLKQ
jgi:flagellar hook protein FlgE